MTHAKRNMLDALRRALPQYDVELSDDGTEVVIHDREADVSIYLGVDPLISDAHNIGVIACIVRDDLEAAAIVVNEVRKDPSSLLREAAKVVRS